MPRCCHRYWVPNSWPTATTPTCSALKVLRHLGHLIREVVGGDDLVTGLDRCRVHALQFVIFPDSIRIVCRVENCPLRMRCRREQGGKDNEKRGEFELHGLLLSRRNNLNANVGHLSQSKRRDVISHASGTDKLRSTERQRPCRGSTARASAVARASRIRRRACSRKETKRDCASEHLRDGVVFVGGQQEVLGEIDLDAIPLEDGVGRRNVDKAVEYIGA